MNYLVKALSYNGEYAIYSTVTTQMMKEIISRQKLVSGFGNKLSDLVSANVLMSASLKKEDEEVCILLESNGMLSQLISNGNMKGEFSGYAVLNSHQANQIVGQEGFLTVSKYLNDKELSNSKIKISSGEISEIIADYYMQSEQINSAVILASLSDKKTNEVYASGGILIQLLPNASEESISELEKTLQSINSLSREVANGLNAEELVYLVDKNAKILESKEVKFHCGCSREKMASSLSVIDSNELLTIIKEDGKIQAVCNFCNKAYVFNDLSEIKKGNDGS